MGRDQTTEEYLLCCGLQVYKIVLSGHWHLWADATFPATSVLQRLTVPTPYTGSLCLDRVSAELLSAQKADPGWVWTLARSLARSGWSLHRSTAADCFIRTLCASRAICFQVSLNGIREKYPPGIIFKGDFKRSPKGGKKRTARLNSRGLPEKSRLARLWKWSHIFGFRGKERAGHNQG